MAAVAVTEGEHSPALAQHAPPQRALRIYVFYTAVTMRVFVRLNAGGG